MIRLFIPLAQTLIFLSFFNITKTEPILTEIHTSFFSQQHYLRSSVIDINQDGFQDLVLGNFESTDSLALLINERNQFKIKKFYLPTGSNFVAISSNKGADLYIYKRDKSLKASISKTELSATEIKDIKTIINLGPFYRIGALTLFNSNNDQYNDFVIGGFYSKKQNYKYQSDEVKIYETFDNKFKQVKVFNDKPSPTFSITACDIDNDNSSDLIVAGYGRRWNKLYKKTNNTYKNHAEEFNIKSDKVGHDYFRGGGNSFATLCRDIDSDGDMDLFQGEITHKWAGITSDRSTIFENIKGKFIRRWMLPRPLLFKNQGDIGGQFADLNGDGLDELILANSDYPPETQLIIFEQSSPFVFHDRTKKYIGNTQIINPKGINTFDYDNDGDLDLYVGSTKMRAEGYDTRNYFFENRSNPKKWLGLNLIGDNKSIPYYPLGTKVIFSEGSKKVIREIGSQNIPDSYQSSRLYFYPKTNKYIITIEWPNKKKEQINAPLSKISNIHY